jgi:hypothetical protein
MISLGYSLGLTSNKQPIGASAGVQLVTCHGLFTTPSKIPPDPFWKDIVHNWRTLSPEALTAMGYPNLAGGWAFESIVADQSFYLRWLQEVLEEDGADVRYVKRHLNSITDLPGRKYQAVFNCSGACVNAVRWWPPAQNHHPVAAALLRQPSPNGSFQDAT